MAAIFSITFPIYAAIAIGYALVARGAFARADMLVLGRYVLNIAMPALLFHALASRPLGQIADAGYMTAYLLGGLAVMGLGFAWFSLTAADRGRRAVAVMGVSCPNSGYVGYPVMLLVIPDQAGVILALNMLVELVVLIPLSLVLLDLSQERARVSPWVRARGIAVDLLKRPLMIALILGLAASALELPIPGTVSKLFQMLAASAAALALVVIGGSLVGLPLNGNRSMAVQIAVGKLVVHPALALLAVVLVSALAPGALSEPMGRAVILSAAMPMMGIYPVLAQERGLGGAASLALLVATTAAFGTLSLALVWLG